MLAIRNGIKFSSPELEADIRSCWHMDEVRNFCRTPGGQPEANNSERVKRPILKLRRLVRLPRQASECIALLRSLKCLMKGRDPAIRFRSTLPPKPVVERTHA